MVRKMVSNLKARVNNFLSRSLAVGPANSAPVPHSQDSRKPMTTRNMRPNCAGRISVGTFLLDWMRCPKERCAIFRCGGQTSGQGESRRKHITCELLSGSKLASLSAFLASEATFRPRFLIRCQRKSAILRSASGRNCRAIPRLIRERPLELAGFLKHENPNNLIGGKHGHACGGRHAPCFSFAGWCNLQKMKPLELTQTGRVVCH